MDTYVMKQTSCINHTCEKRGRKGVNDSEMECCAGVEMLGKRQRP